MTRYVIALVIALAPTFMAAPTARAQTQSSLGGPTFDGTKGRLQRQRSGGEVQEASQGGVDAKAAIAVETGYDSNIEQVFRGVQKSGFALTDGALFLNTGTAAAGFSFLGRGSVADYPDGAPQVRWDAGFIADWHFDKVLDSRLNFGGFFLEDKYGFSDITTGAINYELLREKDSYDAFAKGRIYEVHYSDRNGVQTPQSPLALTSAFSYRKTEQQAGALLYKENTIAPFVSGSIAAIDYFNNVDPSVLNRDAIDGWVLGGVRVKLNKQLYVELGTRYNQRNTEDPRVGTFHSSGFDGRVVWTPISGVTVSLDYDRTITEPGSTDAVLAAKDMVVFAIEYAPKRSKWGLTLYASQEKSKEIGDTPVYLRYAITSEATYLIGPRTQIFATLEAETLDDLNSTDSLTRARIGVGLKHKF
jgi:hypothetical protein